MEQQSKITKIQELTYELKVKDIMTRNVITVSPEQLMAELRAILRDNRISGVPVIEDEKLVGIVSIEDFIICCLEQGGLNSRIRDRMTRNVDTIFADEPVIHAANKFERYGYGRLPVLDRDTGRLVGIVSRGDIVKGLLHKLHIDYQDEEIRRYRASHIFEDIAADKVCLILEYDIKSLDFQHAGECGSRLKKSLMRMNVNPQIVRRAAIAAFEAEMNIVIHSLGGMLILSIFPDMLKLEAHDIGPGIPDIELAMQPGYSTANEKIREMGFGAGMGLCNIKNCADEMRLESVVGKGTDLEVIIYMKDENGNNKGNHQ